MARTFKDIPATISTETMRIRFENMLSKVKNMLNRDNIYSVWIRFVIGKNKDKQIVFDTSSINKDENLIIDFNYEKSCTGTSNVFTLKVAFDLFNYGQETKKNVEQLDELLYEAMNLKEFTKAQDLFYCKFQYGYNVQGDTQIISPLYEGIISEIIPNIKYSNGKTDYTIKGTSFVSGFGGISDYEYDQIGSEKTEDGRWNGLDLVLWILWYYHGNPDTVSQLPRDYSGNLTNQHFNVQHGISPKFNIDIPKELFDTASSVYMPKMEDLTPIDYCKEVLKRTVNTADPHYNGNSLNPGYKFDEGDNDVFTPYYTLYVTDSGGSSCSTIHVTYISSKDMEENQKSIDFSFGWFNRENSLVVGWQPSVDIFSYFALKSQQESDSIMSLESERKEIANANKGIDDAIAAAEKNYNNPYNMVKQEKSIIASLNATKKSNEDKIRKSYEEKRAELSQRAEESIQAKLTLVGIPTDIPVRCISKYKTPNI